MICAIIYEVLRGLLLNLLILFVINMAIFGQARNEWNLKLVSVPLTRRQPFQHFVCLPGCLKLTR